MNIARAITLVILGSTSMAAIASDPSHPTATLQIQSNHPHGLWHYRTYQDGAHCKGISAPIPVAGPVEIKADAPFTFFVSAASSSSLSNYNYCWANVSFTPETGQRYVARFRFGRHDCGIDVVKTDSEGRAPDIPVAIQLRAYKPPFLQSGSWCGKPIKP